MKKEKKNEEITSLNENLYDEFKILELEERLETDPLIIGGLLGLMDNDATQQASEDCFCLVKVECTEQTICVPNVCGDKK